MLRITVHDKPGALTFQLEGELRGPWVRELEMCWQNTRKERRKPILRVDLTGMTFIDTAGKACLAALHRTQLVSGNMGMADPALMRLDSRFFILCNT